MRRSACAVVAGASVVLVAAGCGTSTGGSAEPSTSAAQSVAPQVPSAFDPCTDIPQEVLDSEQLHSTNSSTSTDEMRRGDIAWSGCNWVVSDGYAAGVSATNLTVDMVREKAVPGARETEIHGRAVIIAQHAGPTSCTLNAEMVGGSLEIMADNPPSRRLTGDQNPCDITVRLAEKVLPLIPAGA
ncbi:DUF3558 domain-containing protein [Nocardia carnea]|uniref:DUF3558 domain-containing protein n=1 Tax=Nocardia carnea TaxID=37328 RepID=UPI002458D600|nr:DUF3558 domain-containing protein [Nocardia carnea]